MLCVAGGLCSLTIDKALPEDEGQYKCRAENSAGKAECSCTVLVDGENKALVLSQTFPSVPHVLLLLLSFFLLVFPLQLFFLLHPDVDAGLKHSNCERNFKVYFCCLNEDLKCI